MKDINNKILKMFESPNITLTVEKTLGTKIYSKEYGELIDFQSGCWAAVLGHCRKEFVNTLSKNAEFLFHTHQLFSTEHPAALVNEICSAAELKCNYKGTFMSSGSEAVSLAVSLSELITKRTKKLCFSISKLGSSAELKSPRNPESWLDLSIDECLECTKNSSCSDCGKFSEIDYSEIAAFVFEPGNSGGLVLCPPEKIIEYLSKKVKNAGGLIVVNEVTTGFGRTGKWFGFQHYEYFNSQKCAPDFITMGKGLGNGYPISGVLIKTNLAEIIENSNFTYVQSHTNDPLGCIVSRKVIEIILSENLIEKSNNSGIYLRCKLRELAESTDAIKEIRGIGLMNVIILNNNHKAEEVFIKLLNQGFFTAYNEMHNLIRLYPPLTLEYNEIDKLCLSLKNILAY